MKKPYSRKPFSAEEDEILLKYYGKERRSELANRLNRSIGSVTHRAAKLGINRVARRWTAEEDGKLRALHAQGAPLGIAAKRLDRHLSEVHSRAVKLGIGKWRKSSGRAAGRLIDGFKKGKPIWSHRSVMEKLIGRSLKSSEIVHHIDGNPDNNNPSNLHLFPNRSEHLKAHISAGSGNWRLLFQLGILKFNREKGVYEEQFFLSANPLTGRPCPEGSRR